jgi:hypothetical protein
MSHCLAHGVATHPVVGHEFAIGGEAGVEFAASDPATEVVEQLCPERFGSVSVERAWPRDMRGLTRGCDGRCS